MNARIVIPNESAKVLRDHLNKNYPSPAEPRICEQDALKAVMNVLINMIAEHGEVPAAAAVHIMKTLQDDSMRPIIEAVFALPTTTETGEKE